MPTIYGNERRQTKNAQEQPSNASRHQCVHTKVFWSMVDLRRCALGVSLANTWVRFSSYTKGDIHRSQPVWSP